MKPNLKHLATALLVAFNAWAVPGAHAQAQGLAEPPDLGMPAPAPTAKDLPPLKLWLYVPLRPSETCAEGTLEEALSPARVKTRRLFELTEAWEIEWQAGFLRSEGDATAARRPRMNVDGLCFVLEQGGVAGLRGRVISRHSERLIPVPQPVLSIVSRVGAPLSMQLLAGFPTDVQDRVTSNFLFLVPYTQDR